MVRLSLLCLLMFVLNFAQAQNESWNPYLNQGIISPAPLLPVEFNGTGVGTLNVGNTGSSVLPLVAGDEIELWITLSSGLPNNVNPLAALGGSGLSFFNWTYNAGLNRYVGVQNQPFPGQMLENISVAYRVTENTTLGNANNGFVATIIPPDYANGINSQDDDEVSSYTFVRATDFGDAPLSYGSASADINLFRDINGDYESFMMLGDTIDHDNSYLGSAMANGDDNSGIDDENGVTFPMLMQGTTVNIPVAVTVRGGFGFLNAWIDFDGNGVFDSGEQIANNIFSFSSETINVSVTIPPTAVVGPTFARFRFGEVAGPTGFAAYGEVEDYRVTLGSSNPSIELVKTGVYQDNPPFGIVNAGDQINYQFTVTNTGDVPLTNVIVTDPLVTVMGSAIPVLNAGAVDNTTFTATYIIMQNDINVGIFTNIATVTGIYNGSPVTDDDNDVQSFLQSPQIALLKEGTWNDTNNDGFAQVGETITYNFTVTNTGNVTVSNLEINDPVLGLVNLVVTPSSLNPNQSGTATASYVVTQSAINNGGVYNIATATGQDPNGDDVEDESEDPTPLDPNDPNYDPNCPDCTFTELPFGEGEIGDFVWEDINGNGLQDVGEPGIPNVHVYLYTEAGDLFQTVVTNTLGYYLFENVPVGSYQLRFEIPTGFTSTFVVPGNVNLNSDINTEGITPVFQLDTDLSRLDLDAGFYRCIPVGEVVWYDYNKNDIRENFENGINGLEVNIYRRVGSTWQLFGSTYTGHKPGTPSDDGYWKFCVPPGMYYVEVDMPALGLVRVRPNIGGDPNRDSDLTNANGPMTTGSFTVLSGQMKCDIGIGFYPMAVTGNTVWVDQNSNGIQDFNESKVEGVVVEARNVYTNEVIKSTVTDHNGNYEMDYLETGEVYFKFNLPAAYSDYAPTTPNAGEDDEDSDVDGSFGPRTTRLFVMESSLTNMDIDFGILQGVLPVDWLFVRGVKENEQHTITWATAREVNTSHYIVERKRQGESEFVELPGRVAAKGYSTKREDYVYADKDIRKSGLYTYRVKQFDLDGKYMYSDEVTLTQYAENQIELYPNPAKISSNLTLELAEDSKVTVIILDDAGALARKVMTSANIERGVYTETISLQGLPTGMYTVQIEINGEQTQKKLVIID